VSELAKLVDHFVVAEDPDQLEKQRGIIGDIAPAIGIPGGIGIEQVLCDADQCSAERRGWSAEDVFDLPIPCFSHHRGH
jgi:hypothetical protein